MGLLGKNACGRGLQKNHMIEQTHFELYILFKETNRRKHYTIAILAFWQHKSLFFKWHDVKVKWSHSLRHSGSDWGFDALLKNTSSFPASIENQTRNLRVSSLYPLAHDLKTWHTCGSSKIKISLCFLVWCAYLALMIISFNWIWHFM